MKINKIVPALIIGALIQIIAPITLSAQEVISTKNWQVVQYGDTLSVSFDITADSKLLKSGHALRITPIVKSYEATTELPFILFNGSKRESFYERERNFQTPEQFLTTTPYVKLVQSKDKIETTHYNYVFKLSPEHQNGNLYLRQDVMDCCEYRSISYDQILNENIEFDRTPAPFVAPLIDAAEAVGYIEPEQEKVKIRKTDLTARINFHVNKADIISHYSNNEDELEFVDQALAPLSTGNKNGIYSLKSMKVTGYSSPEGSWDHNYKLALKRASSFGDYLKEKYKLNELDDIKILSNGEDWDGLINLIEEGDMPNKEKVLEIISQYSLDQNRKGRIKSLNRGMQYKYMLTNYYPQLRRMDIVFNYEVRSLSDSEAAAMFETRPFDLSLHEMYRVAQATSNAESSHKIFETAAQQYPNDTVALINASSVSIIKGDLNTAKSRLEKVMNEPLAFNNVGVYYLLVGNYPEAKKYFEQSIENNINTDLAKRNLKIVDDILYQMELASILEFRYTVKK